RYTSQFGFSEMQNLNIELMNSNQLLNFQKQYGQGLGSTLEQWQIDELSSNTNTFWSDVFFRKGVTQSHDIAISSGSEKTTNYTSLSYLDQEGIFVGSTFKRFSVRNNFSGKTANDKFNYAANISVAYSKSGNAPNAGSQAVYFNPFRAALHSLPYISAYDADGSITDGRWYTGVPTSDYVPIVLLNSMAMNTYNND